MLNKIVKVIRWLGEHWVFTLTAFLLVSITTTTIICWNYFGGEQKNMVSVYLYVSGLGEGKDIVNEGRELQVAEEATLEQVFMQEEEIQGEFRSIVFNNRLQSFMGVVEEDGKKFTVRRNGKVITNLSNPDAELLAGDRIEILYE